MSERFHAIVRLDERGDIICFCPYEEYLRGKCGCRERYDCPEAMIDITVLPNSKPSEQGITEIKKGQREIKKTVKAVTKQTNRIKQGVAELEKAIKKSRFRI